jgi:hypothetical protein
VAEHQTTCVNLLVMDLESEVYVGAVMVDELDWILSDFERTETLWAVDFGWGDGWWVRR